MTIDRALLILILVMLVVLAFKPQPGRYQQIDLEHELYTLDTATGVIHAPANAVK